MRFLLAILGVLTALGALGATFNSDGSDSDVQTLIDGASDGDTITIPTGFYPWTTGITISGKGVKLLGLGISGRIICNSLSSVAIGTGTKVFTVTNTLDVLAGQTLRIESILNTDNFMEGTITTYTGDTLTMSIAGDGGSGTHHYWIISTIGTTVVQNNAGSTDLISATEDASHTVEIGNIQFLGGTGTGDTIDTARVSGGRPIQIHDCWFRNGANNVFIKVGTYGGIVWNCSFSYADFAATELAIHAKDVPAGSWVEQSYWGDDDATGTNNFYVEDCDFHCAQNACDWDDSSRGVVRYCWFDSAGFGTHGADTSNYGCRYTEAYKNYFEYHGFSDGTTINNDKIFFIRGGSHIMYSNIWCTLGEGTDFGSKTEVTMMIENLNRSAGPNPCWTDPYHVPRQVGFGRVTGSGLDGQGRSADSITYVGDSEPLYIWDNEVIAGSESFSIAPVNYTSVPNCGGGPDVSGFIQFNRDYFLSAKPSYTGYPYPHPLRSGDSPEPPEAVRVTKLKALKLPFRR